ncbi:hypothetical protein HDV02_000981 [Globomyces sp. JEL0801]|nr:hypothetical protein HDV02_000981 [Globomyces sp. JEL0801]
MNIPILICMILQVICQEVSLNDITNTILQGYDKHMRPQFNKSTTIIKTQYRIDRISNINHINNCFDLDIIVRLQWIDERLVYNQTLGEESLRVDEGSIWLPDLYFLNEIGKMVVLESTLKVSNTGLIFWSRHFIMSFASPFNLSQFPFDHQTLPLKLVSYSYHHELVELKFYDDWEGGAVYPDLKGSLLLWNVDGVDVIDGLVKFREGTPEFDLLQLDIHISRLWSTYLIKYIIPLYFIGLCSSIGYWIDVTALPTRGGFAVSLLLSIVTLNFVMTSDLPKASYSTALDTFISTVFGYVLMSLIEYAVVHVIATTCHNSSELTRFIDVTFRYSPVALSCYAVYVFKNDGSVKWQVWLSVCIALAIVFVLKRIYAYVMVIRDRKDRRKRKIVIGEGDCGEGESGNLVMVEGCGGGDGGAI